MDCLERTQHQTHCPFKGNASYWSLKVAGKVAENAVWSYEEPYRDAEPIRGYLSFYRDKISALYEGDEEVAFLHKSGDAVHGNPIAGWLIEEAWKAGSPEALMGAVLRLPALRRLSNRALHRHHSHAASADLRHGARLARRCRRRAGRVRAARHPAAAAIRRQSVRPDHPRRRRRAPPSRGRRRQARLSRSFATCKRGWRDRLRRDAVPLFRRPDQRHLDDLVQRRAAFPRRISAASTKSCRRSAACSRSMRSGVSRSSLLETYLGRSTGKRVLEGQIKHGDGQLIHAVIWFCDLRNSTNLAGSMDTATYLAHLNRFLGAMAGAIIDHGGEILAYIGDAVLAIFPIAATATCRRRRVHARPPNACAQAIAAARAAAQRIAAANAARPDMPALQYGIGLHVGDVTYGNIGIPQRLQFTVIGSAANEASRIESMTKELGEPVLVSSRFAEHYSGGSRQQGIARAQGRGRYARALRARAGERGLTREGSAGRETVRHRERSRSAEASTMTDDGSGTKQEQRSASRRPRDRAGDLSQVGRTGRRPRAGSAGHPLRNGYRRHEELRRGGEMVSPRRRPGLRRRAEQPGRDVRKRPWRPARHRRGREVVLKAAEQGDANAQHNLGNRFESGDGVPQNYAAADPVVPKGCRPAAPDGAGQSRRHVRARPR